MLELTWDNLDQAFDELEKECEDTIRGLTVRVWDSVLSRTPQFLGRMTASWTYTYDPSDIVNRSAQVEDSKLDDARYTDMGVLKGLRRGHPAAVAIANTASLGRDGSFKLGQTVYLTNGADHGEGPYAGLIESGGIRLRSVNQPGAPVARTLDWVEATWGEGQMSPRAAANLRGLRIGSNGE